MKNPNDPAAKIYDIVYDAYINKEKTRGEVRFIASQLNPSEPILDLGCGTGRHLISLLKLGYTVVGIDESEGMLDVLKKKLGKNKLKAKIINKSIYDIKDFGQKFGGVICFWNAFTEMANTIKEGEYVINLLFNSLDKGGKIIFEETNPNSFDLKKNVFKSKTKKNGKVYETTFETIKVNDKTNVAFSIEEIVVKKNGKVVEKLKNQFTQKWWAKEELENLCKKAGFSKIEFYGDGFKEFKEPSEELILVATK